MDNNGYPEDYDIEALGKIDPLDFTAGADLIEGLINATRIGKANIIRYKDRAMLRVATGGWSGCEEILSEINWTWRAIHWWSSHKGGLHYYEGKYQKDT